MSEQLEKYRFCNWWDKLEKKGIGHGYRTVEVRSVGPKWVYLREQRHKGSEKNRYSKISRDFWEDIKASKYKNGLPNFKTDMEAREEIKVKNRLVETKARSKQGLQTEIYFIKEV